MAIVGLNDRLSNAQAVTGAAISENVIDLGVAGRDLGRGARPLYVVSQVTTTFVDTGNNSNMTVILQTDDNANFSSGTNTQTLGVFATNTAAGAAPLVVPIGAGNANERYLAVYYDVGNGNFTNAAVTTYITADPQLWTSAAKNYTVSTS